MGELLTVLLSFPTILFTGLVILTLAYWLFVILGALDLDSLDSVTGAHADGALEGLHADGAAEGLHAHGGAEGLHAHGGHGVDGADGDFDIDAEGADAGLLAALRLRDAPLTVVISFFSLFGWLITGLEGLTFGVPSLLVGIPLLLGAGVTSLILTSFAIRPLAPAFKTQGAQKNNDLVGKIAIVSTGEVTEKFGQATVDAGGSPFILQIRDTTNSLKRGDRVVVVHFDEEAKAFHVEKLPDELQDVKALQAEAEAEAEAAANEGSRGSGSAKQ